MTFAFNWPQPRQQVRPETMQYLSDSFKKWGEQRNQRQQQKILEQIFSDGLKLDDTGAGGQSYDIDSIMQAIMQDSNLTSDTKNQALARVAAVKQIQGGDNAYQWKPGADYYWKMNPKTGEAMKTDIPVKAGSSYSDPYEMNGMLVQKDNTTGQVKLISKPQSGWTIESDGEGGFKMVQGPMGDKTMQPSKPTVNMLQKNLFESGEEFARLQNIKNNVNPEFLDGWGQLGARWGNLKEKWGAGILEPSEDERKHIDEYSKFQRNVSENLNLYIKRITGAQMSEAEAERLMKAMPNMEMGYQQFMSTLDSSLEALGMSRARAAYALKNGFKGTADDLEKQLPLSQMESKIEDYGQQLEAQLKKQFPNKSQAEIDRMVSAQVQKMFK